jgi:hypothetical protein
MFSVFYIGSENWKSQATEGTVKIMKKYVYLITITIAVLLLLLFGTDPRNVSTPILIAPFALIFLALFLISFYLLRNRGFTRRSSWGIATFISMLPTLLLVLQSIGQLTVRDVAAVFALFLIAYFYATRVDTSVGN